MKVLVVSNNCFSSFQNMGKTMNSFFCAFPKSELCQLYFYSSIPNIDVCKSYFRISDFDIIKAGVFFKPAGQELQVKIDEKTNLYDNKTSQTIYKKFNSSNGIMSLCRTLLWFCGNWNNNLLNNWLKKEKPDCIFFASGDTLFSYMVVYKIHKKYKIPIISYVCDEYYYGMEKEDFLKKIYHKLLKRYMKKVFNKSSLITSICDELGKLYEQLFNCPYCTLNTGSFLQVKDNENRTQSMSNSFVYLGNVGLNRWKSLLEIGMVIDKLNKKLNTNYQLNIYSGESDVKILNAFKSASAINFCGKVSQQECLNILNESLAAIHTESFIADNIKRTKYSMSTKIADTLFSGSSFLVYGSKELSSVNYLYKNDCAFVASDVNELYQQIELIVKNPEIRDRKIKNAMTLALKNHEAYNNSEKFYKICLETLKK